MSNITAKELAVLKAIDHSEYGDEILDRVWTFSIWDSLLNSGSTIKRNSLPGIIASLSKKMLVEIDEDGTDDDCIGMTIKGAIAYISEVGEDDVCKGVSEELLQAARDVNTAL